jgi:hypothetical protein
MIQFPSSLQGIQKTEKTLILHPAAALLPKDMLKWQDLCV